MFFRTFVLFSEQRCEVMLQALIRVAYSILNGKYINGDRDNNKKKKGLKKKPTYNKKKAKKSSVGSASEYDSGDESSEMDEEE